MAARLVPQRFPSSLPWNRSRVNALGQRIQSERPSPVEGYALVSAQGYDEQGRLRYSGQAWSKIPTASTGQAAASPTNIGSPSGALGDNPNTAPTILTNVNDEFLDN